jgi:hypothetical protein
VRRPALAALVLSLLALLFGWETWQALLATPGGQDNAAIPAAAGSWQPGASAPDPPPPPDPAPAAAAVSARPLFRQDRQPFREDAASARNYEAELSRYTLLGVLGFGDVPYGVVVGKGGSKGERWEVKKGDSFQAFTVKEVGMEGLRVTADGKEFQLPLYAGAPTAAGGAVRTETTRRDAAQPASAPVSAAPPRVGAPGRPGAPAGAPAAVAGAIPPPASSVPPPPSASPLANRLRRAPTVPAAPGVSPGTSPGGAPRYTP